MPSHCRLLKASAAALIAVLMMMASAASGQETVLYDINFSAPKHTLNAPPARGGIDGVSVVVMGAPKVVSDFGPLTDRPLLFHGSNGTQDPYEQIQLNGNSSITRVRLDYDVVTQNLKGSGFQFTTLFDTPNASRFDLGGSTDEVAPGRTWEEGKTHHFTVTIDLVARNWSASMDQVGVAGGSFGTGELQSIRFSLGPIVLGSPPNPDVKVAVDNIRVVTIVPPFGPPRFLNADFAENGSSTIIRLDWPSVHGANSYQVYRSTTYDPASATLLATSVGTSYDDRTYQLGQWYNYWVRAVSGSVLSQPSLGASANVPTLRPSSLLVSGPERTTGIHLSWPAAPRATHYAIHRSTGNYHGSAQQIGFTSDLSFEDQTAVPGILYYYWVQSVAAEGRSYFMTPGSGTRGLSAPSGLTVTNRRYVKRIDLRWRPVAGATRYRVYRGESNEFGAAQLLSETDAFRYSDRAVENDIPYQYWVIPVSPEAVAAPHPPVSGLASDLRPDLSLETETGAKLGRGVVHSDQSRDALTERAPNREPLRASLWVEAFGSAPVRVSIVGPPGSRLLEMEYYRGGNITAEVILGRFEVNAGLASGPIRLKATPTSLLRSLSKARQFPVKIRGISVNQPSSTDSVRLNVLSLPKKVEPPERPLAPRMPILLD